MDPLGIFLATVTLTAAVTAWLAISFWGTKTFPPLDDEADQAAPRASKTRPRPHPRSHPS